MRMIGAAIAVVGVLAVAAGLAVAQGKPASSAKKFKFKGGKVETGMLYTYIRSDLAGEKTGSVLVYVPDKKRVEILRVNPGQDAGQLLTGEMNWDTYSLGQFELWREGRDGGRQRQATATFSEASLSFRVEDQGLYRGAAGAASFTLPLTQIPAHLYNLDFVTLGLALRHLAEPMGSADFGVFAENTGVGPDSPNLLVPGGKATVAFLEEVDRDGIPCMKYRVFGPALGDQEGLLWLNTEKGYLQDAEIPVRSSADWPDLKLTLRSAEKLSEGDWPLRRSLEISRSVAAK